MKHTYKEDGQEKYFIVENPDIESDTFKLKCGVCDYTRKESGGSLSGHGHCPDCEAHISYYGGPDGKEEATVITTPKEFEKGLTTHNGDDMIMASLAFAKFEEKDPEGYKAWKDKAAADKIELDKWEKDFANCKHLIPTPKEMNWSLKEICELTKKNCYCGGCPEK